MRERRRVLLLSNSTQHGSGYLDHADQEIRSFLGPVRNLVFFPYAVADRVGYGEQVRERFARMGVAVVAPLDGASARLAVREAGAVFVGGGNTFRLLRALHRMDLVAPIRERVTAGIPYIGSSAGSNVAGPTIKTTKDMPIVEPPTFSALGLIAFQISPHYVDPDTTSTHMGETQEERIRQFHEENATPVAGLREGAILRIEGPSVELRGACGARFFRRDREPVERVPVCEVSDLVEGAEGAAS